MTDPTHAQAEGEELREGFEAWARTQSAWREPQCLSRLHPGGAPYDSDPYESSHVDVSWRAWKAAAALSRRAPPAAAGEEPEWGRGVRLQSLTSDGLEPCPACGRSAAWLRRWMQGDARRWVRCMNCKTQGPTTCDDEEAKAAWNALSRRALLTPPAAAIGKEAIERAIRTHMWGRDYTVGPAEAATAILALLPPPAAEGGLVEALEQARLAFWAQPGRLHTPDHAFDAGWAAALAAHARQGHAADGESAPAQAGGGDGA